MVPPTVLELAPAGDQHAVLAVGQRLGAGDVGADIVRLDHVGVGAGRLQLDAVKCVAGDDVAGGGRAAAHRVEARPGSDVQAVFAVGNGAGAGGVGADIIPFDHVVFGARTQDEDAQDRVAGDDVAGGGRGAAHRVEGRPADDLHAILAVGQRLGAGDVGADIISFDHVARGARRVEHDAVEGIAGDDVTRARRRSAHRVGSRPGDDVQAVDAVGDRRGPRGIGADKVPIHEVARRPRVGDIDADDRVAGDDVAGARGGPAHRVVARAAVDQHAVLAVGQGLGAGDVGADIVPLNQVVRGARVGDQDTVAGVAGDHVEGTGCRAAQRVEGRTAEEVHAVLAVGHDPGAGDVGADIVPLDHVVLGARVGQRDAAVLVAGDDVVRASRRPAHRVRACAGDDVHAVDRVGHGPGAGGIGADIIPFHDVARRARAGDDDAELPIAGDDVAGRPRWCRRWCYSSIRRRSELPRCCAGNDRR